MSNVTNKPHGKFVISHETLDRIEKITNTKVLRGMDFTLNMDYQTGLLWWLTCPYLVGVT